MEEDADRRCKAKAKQMGFSSWEEYNKHNIEEDRKAEIAYERRMDEKCALLGKTREELYAEDPQRLILDDEGLGECDCDGQYLSPF